MKKPPIQNNFPRSEGVALDGFYLTLTKVQGMPWLFWQKKKAAFALICKGRPLKFMGEDRSVNYKSKLKRTKFECGFQDGTFDPAKLFFTTANRDHGCDFVIIVANDHILFG